MRIDLVMLADILAALFTGIALHITKLTSIETILVALTSIMSINFAYLIFLTNKEVKEPWHE